MTEDTGTTTDNQDETEQLEDALDHDQASHGGHPGTTAEATTETEGVDLADNPDGETDPAAGEQAGDEEETPAETAATPTPPRKLSGAAKTRHEAKEARERRLQEAQDQIPEPEAPSDAEVKELERKAELQAQLSVVAEEIQEYEDGIDLLKAKGRELMAELYPHTVKSDRHVDAVRGYLRASQEERRNRGAHPARLKELLERAGKAPIDAAFQRARARGQGRPTRSPVGQGKIPGQGDQAKDATPGSEA